MKELLFFGLLFSVAVMADTPPPGTVKSKTFSGDGNTGITATGTALNVNVVNQSGLNTVNQGTAGGDPWLVEVEGSNLPTNACQETGGHLASIDSKLTSPLAVTGTFFQTTQPVSAASLPLPAGAATAAKQPALGSAGSASSDVLTVQGVAGMTALKTDGSATTQPVSGTVTANAGTGTLSVDASGHTVPVSGSFFQATQPVSGTVTAVSVVNGTIGNAAPSIATQVGGKDGSGNLRAILTETDGTQVVDGSSHTQPVSGTFFQTTQPVSGTFWQATQPVSGTFFQATQPVSASSLPLPTGASTSAKQPALGTAGSASADVITVQGVASMTALKVDGSGVTQPVSAVSLPLPAGAATSALQSKAPISTTGSGSSAAATVSTVATLTAPANAVGFILMNIATSTTNMRWAVGRTASTTLGQQLQPGRDTGFVPIGANISIIAESGTVTYDVQWIAQ